MAGHDGAGPIISTGGGGGCRQEFLACSRRRGASGAVGVNSGTAGSDGGEGSRSITFLWVIWSVSMC